MTLPSPDTPLYNHPLPQIEQWLSDLGAQQDRDNLHCWKVERPTWKADLCLDVEELVVCYINAGADGSDIKRSFKYSLSRQDIEAAVFSGP
ncbi:MAG: DUF3143 domain-containing protein [Hydrococcus sp. C42_A2020_068]|uniref:DUF3143 domain-containing protein n=1 Tax=Pleurocapsa sp. PCC 7327 TaxID=118163 RepID=UPI00029FCFAC|nr:DUF3143 domain-containing protein [Pleurocapsa sp. PCC 7327]AFY79202.1 Protein of unknown function (DUF3143) [Pleurocapsa sp. PCC 7327]MBF2020686.1 DUF3143 domain-containing protein [Hydrococcus sp. C42_A2020_068]